MTINETIRRYCVEQEGAAYVYGATGKPCTPSLRRAQAKQYPDFAPKIVEFCPVLSGTQGACAGCQYDGKLAFDCAQLTRRAAEAAGLRLPSGAKSQFNGKSPHSGWVAGGPIDQLPYEQVAYLYRKTADGGVPHTGVYMGDGWVMDARGHAQGVVRSLLNAYRWTDFRVLAGQELAPGAPLLEWKGPALKPEKKDDGGEAQVIVEQRDLIVIPGQKLMRGQDVLDAQAALIDRGYGVGDKGPDGVYGWDTANAVKAFQRDHGLAEDGVWSREERDKMAALLAKPPTVIVSKPEPINHAAMLEELDKLNKRQAVIIKAMREVG
jgi:hypothetical protein